MMNEFFFQANSVQNEALFDVLVAAVDILTKIDMIKVPLFFSLMMYNSTCKTVNFFFSNPQILWIL